MSNSIYHSAEWIPRTYYILENNTSGKKYIGQTRQNMNKYRGSGKYWKTHCAAHGGQTTENITVLFNKIFESSVNAAAFLADFEKNNPNYWMKANNEWANLVPETIDDSPLYNAEIARKAAKDRLENGTHNFLCKVTARKNSMRRVMDGTHNFMGDGTFQSQIQHTRVANGTHPFLDGTHSSKAHARRLDDGTHHMIQLRECPHCGKTGKGAIMNRWHFDNCKSINKKC